MASSGIQRNGNINVIYISSTLSDLSVLITFIVCLGLSSHLSMVTVE